MRLKTGKWFLCIESRGWDLSVARGHPASFYTNKLSVSLYLDRRFWHWRKDWHKGKLMLNLGPLHLLQF